MENKNVLNSNSLNTKVASKRITPDVLQELFMDYARELDNDRLLTALKTLCYIARFGDDFEGNFFSFDRGGYEIPYDYLFRLERFVRTSM